MIKPSDNGVVHCSIELFKVANLINGSGFDRNQDDIVVTVAVWIVAFPEGGLILFQRKPIGMKPVGGAKPIASGHCP